MNFIISERIGQEWKEGSKENPCRGIVGGGYVNSSSLYQTVATYLKMFCS